MIKKIQIHTHMNCAVMYVVFDTNSPNQAIYHVQRKKSIKIEGDLLNFLLYNKQITHITYSKMEWFLIGKKKDPNVLLIRY